MNIKGMTNVHTLQSESKTHVHTLQQFDEFFKKKWLNLRNCSF